MEGSTGDESELADSRRPVPPASADNQPSTRRGALTELAYWDPIVGFVVPAAAVALALAAVKSGSWWVLAFAVVFLVGAWTATAQRLDIEHGAVTASFLPFRRWQVSLPITEARFTYDAVYLYVGRLDGSRVGRRRKNLSVRSFEISGPPSVVFDLRERGIYVERVPTLF